jgi:hypothetical protein
MSWELASAPLLSAAELEAFTDCARRAVVNPEVVRATGTTRGDDGMD